MRGREEKREEEKRVRRRRGRGVGKKGIKEESRGAEERGKTTKSSQSVAGPASLLCFNVSNNLETGLWEVVTPTKPLTAAILHRGCEQLPDRQCLTEIIAVPTGSFGRQMVEAIPIHLPAAIS